MSHHDKPYRSEEISPVVNKVFFCKTSFLNNVFVGGFHYNLRPLMDALELIDYFFCKLHKEQQKHTSYSSGHEGAFLLCKADASRVGSLGTLVI